MIRKLFADRFWSKVRKTEGCRLWEGAKVHAQGQTNRYGSFWTGVGEITALAHRVAYELVVGPIPSGMTRDHLCANTLCVRPDHVETVSREENTRLQHVRRRELAGGRRE